MWCVGIFGENPTKRLMELQESSHDLEEGWRIIIESTFKGGESWGYDMMYYFGNMRGFVKI